VAGDAGHRRGRAVGPPLSANRWLSSRSDGGDDYDRRLAERPTTGPGVHGEADLVFALAPATVLDAGCGTGRVTRLLLERLPRGHVVAVDAAPSMVEAAREALGERATVIESDLVDLELDEPVDAVFSNAVFHWIPDHDRLFASMYAALRPGGMMIAQCGGEGNVAGLLRLAEDVGAEPPFAAYLAGWERPTRFASPEKTREKLEAAGFVDVDTSLEPWPVQPPEPREFMRTVCHGLHLERLPAELRDAYVDAVAKRAGERPTLEYVRLNISARRD
jgi:trans-aconitate 2-methyltransferase